MAERRYVCKSCGWDDTNPLPVEEVAGERLLWRVWLCPQCWLEVAPVEGPEPPRPTN
jgi:rubredoxin